MIGGGRKAVQNSSFRRHGRAGADRCHDAHLAVHRAHPVEQGRDRVRVRRLVEQRPGAAAAGHHQQIERLLPGPVEVPVRRHRGAVDAFYIRHGPADQHNFKRVGRRRRVARSEKARDREGFDEAEHVDRLESIIDEDADPLGSRKRGRSCHPISPVPTSALFWHASPDWPIHTCSSGLCHRRTSRRLDATGVADDPLDQSSADECQLTIHVWSVEGWNAVRLKFGDVRRVVHLHQAIIAGSGKPFAANACPDPDTSRSSSPRETVDMSGNFSRMYCGLAGLLVLLGLASPVLAQQPAAPSSRLFRNPAELQPVPPQRAPGQSLVILSAPSVLAPQQEVTFDLNVKYTDAKILNPYFGNEEAVRLRSYNGSLTAPTISVYPSQTVRIRLQNQLPAESENDCPPPPARIHSAANCLSTTNLHFHGLHVSPTGNSDNVLLEHAPNQNFEYEVNIPVDHPAGTFWYHSHRHGSTAAQVSSGMVGALIVRGKRTLDKRAENGGIADIDTILKNANGSDIKENVILLQQIAYACFDNPGDDTITTKLTSDGKKVWFCPPGKAGEVKYYSTQFGPGSWRSSGHFTMITGNMQPQFGEWKPGEGEPIRAGEIQRWRMIHGGVRDTVSLQIIKATDIDSSISTAPPRAETSNWVSQHCTTGE